MTDTANSVLTPYEWGLLQHGRLAADDGFVFGDFENGSFLEVNFVRPCGEKIYVVVTMYRDAETEVEAPLDEAGILPPHEYPTANPTEGEFSFELPPLPEGDYTPNPLRYFDLKLEALPDGRRQLRVIEVVDGRNEPETSDN